MTEVSSLAETWDALRAELPDGRPGRARRLVHPEGKCEQTVELTAPEHARSLCLSIPSEAVPDLDLPDPTAGIACRIIGSRSAGLSTVELTQTEAGDDDLFVSVASDIAASAAKADSEVDGIAAWIGRLRQWQRLLKRAPEGLSGERQRGLWGELWFLREQVISRTGVEAAVGAWVGAAGGAHDFHLGSAWIEVKTTAANRPNVVRINGERQLEVPPNEELYLLHQAINVREGSGQTLPEMVASVRDLVEGTGTADELEDRLFGAGYADAHAHRYRRVGYDLRSIDPYEVVDGFPRLTEADLPEGIGSIAYSLSLDACASFRCVLEAVLPGGSGHVG